MVMVTTSFASANTFTTKQLISADDIIPPSIPTSVVATAVAQTQIDITWASSTDNVGVAGYVLSRDGFILATVTAPQTTYNDAGLTPSTTYAYTLRAFDVYLNYSTSSATTTATTFSVVATPQATTTEGSITSTLLKPTDKTLTVKVTAGTDRALVDIESRVGVRIRLLWGENYDVSEGIIDTLLYKHRHSTRIVGLSPNTDYWLLVIATDAYGNSVEKRVQFHTQNDIRETVPTNPSNFEGLAKEDGIYLTWRNPTDTDFKEVRIIRKEGDIATDPYDGVPIYEGAREAFIDTGVIDGGIYGYTLFARTADGSFSSGAVLVIRAFSKQTIGDATVTVIPHGEGETGQHLLDSLTIVQDGIVHMAGDKHFTVAGDRAFTLSLEASAVPRVLKTIMVTMRDSVHTEKTFSFLLRINKEGSAYEARIGALGKVGVFLSVLSVLNAETQSIESVTFTIESEQIERRRTGDYAPSGGMTKTQLVMYFGLLLIVFLIIARFLQRKRNNKGSGQQ